MEQTAMIPDICTAIHKRKLLQFYYGPGNRIIEPYAYGVGDGGRELLRGYQRSGESHSREEGWKLFRVDEIQDVVLLDDNFDAPRLGYMRNDPSMTQIYAEL
jgi:predicted DNA-binding transcriptional regulator YafY